MGTAGLWYIGIILETLATMSGTLGKQMIRLSENIKDSNPRCSSIIFKVGLVVNTVTGPVLEIGAYAFAPQSLVAPFNGLDAVWNTLFAPCILKEQLTKRYVIGAAIVVAGTAGAGSFGSHRDQVYTLEYAEEKLISLRVLLYCIFLLLWFALNRFYLMKWPIGSPIRGLSLGWTAGALSGNAWCMKAILELAKSSIFNKDGSIWLHWLPYVLAIGALFFAISNLVYMTKGLQEFEALFMITIYEGSVIVAGSVSGAVVLNDLNDLEPWRVGMYSFSIALIVTGMYVIFTQQLVPKTKVSKNVDACDEAPDQVDAVKLELRAPSHEEHPEAPVDAPGIVDVENQDPGPGGDPPNIIGSPLLNHLEAALSSSKRFRQTSEEQHDSPA